MIWESLGLSTAERLLRLVVSALLTFAFLMCGFALVYYAKLAGAIVATKFPTADCSSYAVTPFLLPSGAYERGDLAGTQLTPVNVLRDQRPKDYGLDSGNTGASRPLRSRFWPPSRTAIGQVPWDASAMRF